MDVEPLVTEDGATRPSQPDRQPGAWEAVFAKALRHPRQRVSRLCQESAQLGGRGILTAPIDGRRRDLRRGARRSSGNIACPQPFRCLGDQLDQVLGQGGRKVLGARYLTDEGVTADLLAELDHTPQLLARVVQFVLGEDGRIDHDPHVFARVGPRGHPLVLLNEARLGLAGGAAEPVAEDPDQDITAVEAIDHLLRATVGGRHVLPADRLECDAVGGGRDPPYVVGAIAGGGTVIIEPSRAGEEKSEIRRLHGPTISGADGAEIRSVPSAGDVLACQKAVSRNHGRKPASPRCLSRRRRGYRRQRREVSNLGVPDRDQVHRPDGGPAAPPVSLIGSTS
jgi:hypothetical protein